MRIDFGRSIAGRPLSVARDLLKRHEDCTVEDAAAFLKAPLCEAEVFLHALEAEAFVAREVEFGRTIFRSTALGMSLRKARKWPRLKRERSAAVLARLTAEIEAINADPQLIAWVAEADLFGSILTDANDLGDIDVAVRLVERPVEGDWTKASLARASAARVRGSFLIRLDWGRQELWRRMRRVSRYLDLQDKREIESLETPMFSFYRRS